MAAAAILDFQFMWIWPFWRVDSVVFVLCTEFGSNICYSHGDRRTLCFKNSFDGVTQSNFRFQLLLKWLSPHGSDASFHIIRCKISLSSPQLLTFFPKFKMATAVILDFQFMWIWPFRRFGNSFVFCTKFGSYICYSRWDRRTYASDVYLMTSRELTSGFDFGYLVISYGTTFFDILRHQQPLWVSTQSGIKRRSKILELELLQEQSILTIKQ